jgi:hypothetical protein
MAVVMHAYQPYSPVGNMGGKCSAQTEHSVRGDRLLGCNRPASDPIHTGAASQSAAQHAEDDAAGNPLNRPECPYCGQDIWPGEPQSTVTVDGDPGDPEVGPQPDIHDAPAHTACHEQWLVERARRQQEADIAAGVEYASESPLPRPTPEQMVEIVASAVAIESENQVGYTLHELADWYSDSHPEDQPYRGSPEGVTTVHSHTRRTLSDMQRPEWVALMRDLYDPHYDPFDTDEDPGVAVESRETEMLRAAIQIMGRLLINGNIQSGSAAHHWALAATEMVGDQS